MFVRFECGCAGLRVPDHTDIVIRPCEGDGDLSFHRRDLSDKSHSELSADKVDQLVMEIGALVGDGHRFREVRSLLAG